MKKTTMKDIANHLGVTVGTVSHVLNDLPDISEETKKRVIAAAKELGYIPNQSAISLRSGRTQSVAFIIPDISNPHIAYQAKLLEDKMRENNYSVMFLNTNEDSDAEYAAIVSACSRGCDGIFLCPAPNSESNIAFLEKLNIPYLLVGRYFKKIDTDYVCADDYKGGQLAAEYLLRKGCSNPIYIGAYKHIESSYNRFNGMKDVLSKNSINLSDDRYIGIYPPNAPLEHSLECLINNDVQFDSLVAFNDLLAFETISFLKKHNICNIPFVGFDALNSHLNMPFSYVSIGMVNGGWAEKASNALISKINGSKKRCKELIDVELIEF